MDQAAAPPAPPPTAQPLLQFCIAAFELGPSGIDNQLMFKAGEKLTILRTVDSNWYFGRTESGKTGIFPASYVRNVVTETEEARERRLQQEERRRKEEEQRKLAEEKRRKEAEEERERVRQEQKRLKERLIDTYLNPTKKAKLTSVKGMETYLAPLVTPQPLAYQPRRPTAHSDKMETDAERAQRKALMEERERTMTATATEGGDAQAKERFYIWDLDETLVVFRDLVNGKFAKENPDKSPETLRILGESLHSYLLHITDGYFHFPDVEELVPKSAFEFTEHDTDDDLTSHDFSTDGFQKENQKLVALRYRDVREYYEECCSAMLGGKMKDAPPPPPNTTHIAIADYTPTIPNSIPFSRGDFARVVEKSGDWWLADVGGRRGWVPRAFFQEIATRPKDAWGGLSPLFSEIDIDRLRDILKKIDILTEGWLSTARRTVAAAKSATPSPVFAVVTSSQVIPALAKLLLFGLYRDFPLHNVYSSRTVGKEAVFREIIAAHGDGYEYIAIGDGAEEEAASKAVGISFMRTKTLDELWDTTRKLELMPAKLNADFVNGEQQQQKT